MMCCFRIRAWSASSVVHWRSKEVACYRYEYPYRYRYRNTTSGYREMMSCRRSEGKEGQ